MSGELVEVAADAYAWVQGDGSWGMSNAGIIVTADGIVAIDSLYTIQQTLEMMDAVRERAGAHQVRSLLITHHHGDHAFASHVMEPQLIVAHDRCIAEMNRAGQPDEAALSRRFPMFNFHDVRYPSPDVAFDSSLGLMIAGGSVHARYLGPAHTVGDIVVHSPQHDVMWAGDLLFNGSTPVCLEGSIQGWVEALDLMLDYDVRVFVPGHGPVCDRAGVAACRKYLMKVLEHGSACFEKGESIEVAARQFAMGEFADWANPERIIGNLARLYAELRGEPPTSDIGVDELRRQMSDMAATEVSPT